MKKKNNQQTFKAEAPILVAFKTINLILKDLRQRGVVIRDWDNKKRMIHSVQLIGSRAFYYTKNIPGTEANENGNTQHE